MRCPGCVTAVMDGTCATEDFPEPSPNIAPAPPCTLAEHGRALLSRVLAKGLQMRLLTAVPCYVAVIF